MTIEAVFVRALWFLAGVLTMALLVRAKWQELAAENRALEEEVDNLHTIGRHLFSAATPPATAASLLALVDAQRPVGISREEWFKTVRALFEKEGEQP